MAACAPPFTSDQKIMHVPGGVIRPSAPCCGGAFVTYAAGCEATPIVFKVGTTPFVSGIRPVSLIALFHSEIQPATTALTRCCGDSRDGARLDGCGEPPQPASTTAVIAAIVSPDA